MDALFPISGLASLLFFLSLLFSSQCMTPVKDGINGMVVVLI